MTKLEKAEKLITELREEYSEMAMQVHLQLLSLEKMEDILRDLRKMCPTEAEEKQLCLSL